MTLRSFGVGLALLATSACMDGPTEPQCDTLASLAPGAVGDTVNAADGLRYITTQAAPDTATVSARSCLLSQVQYALFLTTSSDTVDAGAFIFTPGRNQVIPGFEQGVVGMEVGERRRLIVPPALGYGSVAQTDQAGNVVIPANSTLIFDVNLLAAESDR